MCLVLDRDTIGIEIVPYILKTTRGFPSSVPLAEIINAILYKLKTGFNGNMDEDQYFDQELYDQRHAIERTNAWMNGYRSLLNRFDTTTESWKGFNYLAFITRALKKIKNKKSTRLETNLV